jgi:Mlc titration factor MtfA (ptsG expression regulator)
MDGSLDGVPEILLERKYVAEWKQLLEQTMDSIRQGQSDIDAYGATSLVECFAVIAEYFFEQPALFHSNHPQLYQMLQRIFVRK